MEVMHFMLGTFFQTSDVLTWKNHWIWLILVLRFFFQFLFYLYFFWSKIENTLERERIFSPFIYQAPTFSLLKLLFQPCRKTSIKYLSNVRDSERYLVDDQWRLLLILMTWCKWQWTWWMRWQQQSIRSGFRWERIWWMDRISLIQCRDDPSIKLNLLSHFCSLLFR